MSRLFDPALQPERTELSWRRTSLALGAGSLVAIRLLPVALGIPWTMAIGVAGVIAAAGLWIAARRRRVRTVRALLDQGDRARLPGAAALMALVVVSTSAGVLGLLVVLARLAHDR
jgi:uncharacterized membrane protein YidH (DUF202 family)